MEPDSDFRHREKITAGIRRSKPGDQARKDVTRPRRRKPRYLAAIGTGMKGCAAPRLRNYRGMPFKQYNATRAFCGLPNSVYLGQILAKCVRQVREQASEFPFVRRQDRPRMGVPEKSVMLPFE